MIKIYCSKLYLAIDRDIHILYIFEAFYASENSLLFYIFYKIYHIFSKYGPGVNYFQIASDQVLN